MAPVTREANQVHPVYKNKANKLYSWGLFFFKENVGQMKEPELMSVSGS